jgi:hypothetical protein
VNPEYDFSEGTRGKFYRADVRLRLPIYLDAEVQQFVERIAEANSKPQGASLRAASPHDVQSRWPGACPSSTLEESWL